MPVFDFSETPDSRTPAVCTYTTFQSSEPAATPEKPILILDNSKKQWAHHSNGIFTNPNSLKCSKQFISIFSLNGTVGGISDSMRNNIVLL